MLYVRTYLKVCQVVESYVVISQYGRFLRVALSSHDDGAGGRLHLLLHESGILARIEGRPRGQKGPSAVLGRDDVPGAAGGAQSRTRAQFGILFG